MLKQLLVTSCTFLLAFIVLFVSILRSATIKYNFNSLAYAASYVPSGQAPEIDYDLPEVGFISPQNPAWFVKVLVDKSLVAVNTDHLKKAEVLLSVSDSRLTEARKLFKNGNFDLGISVLTKAEKYLENSYDQTVTARRSGMRVNDFLSRLALASLKHREVAESFLSFMPDEGRPIISQTVDYPKRVFRNSKIDLQELRLAIPETSFSHEN